MPVIHTDGHVLFFADICAHSGWFVLFIHLIPKSFSTIAAFIPRV
jgi:hypothetical protein